VQNASPLLHASSCLAFAACGDVSDFARVDGPLDCAVSAIERTSADDVQPRGGPMAWTQEGAGKISRFEVWADDAPVAGSYQTRGGALVFVPSAPLPPNAQVAWSAEACGRTFGGSFVTSGAVHAMDAVEVDEVFAGHVLTVDLRIARWQRPTPRTDLAALLLRWHFLPALRLQLHTVDAQSVAVRVAPAAWSPWRSDTDDAALPAVETQAPLDASGGIHVQLPTLTAIADGAPVVLHDADLTLGLTRQGIRNGQLHATLELQGDIAARCEAVARFSDGACAPCEGADKLDKSACIALALDDVASLGIVE
jgi:hypothetical protein